MSSVGSVPPNDPAARAAAAAEAAAAKANAESAGGVISMLQRLLAEFKGQLAKGNITLTEMKKLVNLISGLQGYMTELQDGKLSQADAAKLLNGMKALYNFCTGKGAPKGAKSIWTGLASIWDKAAQGMNKDWSALINLFMKNPDAFNPSQVNGLAILFHGLSNDIAGPPPDQKAMQFAGGLANGIDQAMSGGDSLSQALSNKLAQIENMAQELVKAEAKVESKFYQTLMQQIKLAQPS